MAEFLNPAQYLDELAHVFQVGAGKPTGLTLDPDPCLAFAEGLADVVEKVEALVTFAASQGLVTRFEPAPERPRTPTERRHLARLAVALDPDARVVRFPEPAIRTVATAHGGSAA